MVLDRDVVEPWTPAVGDWVRIEIGPECKAWHSQRGEPVGAYGQVQAIDRAFDDPEQWVANVEQVGLPGYGEREARADARKHIGHYYYVSDTEIATLVDMADGIPDDQRRGPVTWIDGYYCAFELTKVHYAEAVRAIAEARRELRAISPGERLWRAVIGNAS